MARAPFQVLVIPWRRAESGLEYALLRRADSGYWQPVAGGGEDDETPAQAARREAQEEIGAPPESPLLRLDSVESIRVTEFRASAAWGEQVYVIPQYCFGLEFAGTLQLSDEHSEARWLPFAQAEPLLRFDGNRTALWELHRRLSGGGPRGGAERRQGLGWLPPAWQTERPDALDVRPGDVDVLHALFSACQAVQEWDDTFRPVPPAEIAELVQRSQDAGPEWGFFRLQLFRRRTDARPLGYFHLHHGRPAPEQCWLSIFLLHPAYQKQRYADEVAQGLWAQLRGLGYTTVRLRVYLKNWPALRFWTRQGFRSVVKIEGDPLCQPGAYASIVLDKFLTEA